MTTDLQKTTLVENHGPVNILTDTDKEVHLKCPCGAEALRAVQNGLDGKKWAMNDASSDLSNKPHKPGKTHPLELGCE